VSSGALGSNPNTSRHAKYLQHTASSHSTAGQGSCAANSGQECRAPHVSA
jgi:hypothetical protein